MENNKIYCTGNTSVALGIDAKITPNGKCNHPYKKEFRQELLWDGLPVPMWEWSNCIFCKNGECVYAGECEHREEYKDGK